MLVGYVDENRDVKWREVPENNDKMSKDRYKRNRWENSSNELIKIQKLNKEKAIVANERINQIQTEIEEFKVKVEVEEKWKGRRESEESSRSKGNVESRVDRDASANAVAMS